MLLLYRKQMNSSLSTDYMEIQWGMGSLGSFNLFKEKKCLSLMVGGWGGNTHTSFMEQSSQPLVVILLKRLPCFTALNLLWTEY